MHKAKGAIRSETSLWVSRSCTDYTLPLISEVISDIVSFQKQYRNSQVETIKRPICQRALPISV